MVRRALFLVIFVVVAAALVAGYGGGEQPEGGGGQDEAGGEAGGSAGSGSSGDFAFVGFYAEIVNWVVSDCALVSAGALLEIVTLPENALVPLGAEITTQEDAETLQRCARQVIPCDAARREDLLAGPKGEVARRRRPRHAQEGGGERLRRLPGYAQAVAEAPSPDRLGGADEETRDEAAHRR